MNRSSALIVSLILVCQIMANIQNTDQQVPEIKTDLDDPVSFETSGRNSASSGNNSTTDAHCLILNNLTMNQTYHVSIYLVNTCSDGINYPGINASSDHSGVDGLSEMWWYLIPGANTNSSNISDYPSYHMNYQLSLNQSIPNGTTITLYFEATVLHCGPNNSWSNDCPNSNNSNLSYQFTYPLGYNSTTNNGTLSSTRIEITEVGLFKSSFESTELENGTEYPVLYLKESFHIDAIMTDSDGNPIPNKCLNIYVDPLENNIPIVTTDTSSNGTIEWFSGDPLQNPSLRGVETTGGKLEGFRTIRIAYEPAGGNESLCAIDNSGNLTSSYADIDVLVMSRTDLLVKKSWSSIGENSVIDGEIITGEVALLRDRLDLAVENETIGFQFYYTIDGINWILSHEESNFTNEQGYVGFEWTANFVEHDNCASSTCYVDWKIIAYHPGSLFFPPSSSNITLQVTVFPDPSIDSDGDGVGDDDTFPQDPDGTHDDDGNISGEDDCPDSTASDSDDGCPVNEEGSLPSIGFVGSILTLLIAHAIFSRKLA